MKQNFILVYDDNCPLCSWYSKIFVKVGLLPAKGRVAFTKAQESLFSAIDLEKAKNQIPLIDTGSHKVYYGIDALVEVLSQHFSFIKIICKWSFVNWFLRKLYKLISFNRKVIVGKKCGKGQFDCSPAFSPRYRIAFMMIFLFFNSFMLWPIHQSILSTLPYYKLNFLEFEFAHLLFVLVNCILACTLPKKLALEYLGQVNMVALITVLLCTPLLLITKIFNSIHVGITIYLFATTVFIIREYFRRMNYAGIFSRYKLIAGINLICVLIFLSYLFI